jgi:aryl-alcohol dehydrogenase-like predicted oxidoreductase
MDSRQLGRSGLRVSPLCLGTANFGWVTDTATAHRMLSRAFDDGVTFVDTADTYNRRLGDEATELVIGRWLGDALGRRQQVVLATKVYGATGDGANDSGLSARHIRLACEESLRRLRTDWIDIYMLHHVDLTVRWEETLEALGRLIDQGKILYIGTSNFAAWQLTTLHLISCEREMLGLISEQSPYSLAERRVEFEVLPACRHYGIGFLAYSPLAEGFLGGPEGGLRRDEGATAERRRREAEKLRTWHACCREHGIAPPSAALAWVLAQPGVVSAVIGPRTESQLESCLDAANLHLDDPTLDAIAAEWPGPGVAPKAYTW